VSRTEPEPEFLEIFKDEARERLDRIVETLLSLENGTARDDAVDSLFRDTHTIKGAAGMVGRDEIRTLAHAMEDVLAAARAYGSYPAELTDLLLRAADAIRRHVEGASLPTESLLHELRRALDRGGATMPAVASSAAATTPRAQGRRAIRVPPEKIDTLLDLVGETVLHRRRLEHVLETETERVGQSISDELDVGERLLDNLKDAAVGMRTLPLATITGPLPRAVRDLAVEAGKEAELTIVGAETELDRAVLERLTDLLVHLLRNAVAHGIEHPAEREHLGKPRRGRVELRAQQRGGVVEVSVGDDGRGVSEQVLAEAQSSSLVEVLAAAGYSTADEVSELSGRGVGLDAVKRQVESVGGTLELRSVPAKGTDVIMRLPLALALLDVLLVERGENVYGLPLASVEEVLSIADTTSLGGRPAIELRGRSIPVADIVELVGGTPARHSDRAPAIVVAASGRRVAAVCDALIGKEEVVVKPLGPLLQSLSTYLGAAILGDGRIALLVDPLAAVRSAGRRAVATTPDVAPVRTGGDTPRVLVVEDSLAVRELQRGILEAAGYQVETARDGREALDRLGRDETIELVLTDVDMPEVDGIELTKTIRADPAREHLPIVIVTSKGEDDDRRRGIDAGADAYMVKRSFDQQALLDTVERLIGR
jgi:two-component system, chemotaxis family, sensor kinase CheA